MGEVGVDRQPGARRSPTSCRCRATCSSAVWSRPTSTPARRWSSCSRPRRPVQFYAVPGMPDYHPEFPGGSPEGGRTLECPIYPFDELGEWAARVTPSPYFADPHITMSETPLGKAVPEPPSPEEHERRRGPQRARLRPGARRPAAAGLPRPRHRAPHVVRRPRADLEDGAVVGVLVDTPDGPVEVRADQGRRAGVRRLRVERGAAARVPARPDDPPGLHRDEHRRRAADGDEGRGDALQHARGVVDPRRCRAGRGQPAGSDPRQRPADAAALDHGQPSRPALHERGGQLQRLRRCLPRRGRVPLRVRQPAVLAGVRPELRRHLRLPRRGRRRRRAGPVVGPAGRHAGRAGRRRRHRRRRARAHDRALERRCAPRGTIPTSGAATAPSTAGGATRTARAAATPRSGRSSGGRTTRSRSTAARSAPRAVPGSIPTPACSTSTAIRSSGCTRPATSWARRSA